MASDSSIYRLLLLLAVVFLETNTFVIPYSRFDYRSNELQQTADLSHLRLQMAESNIFVNPSEYSKVFLN